MTIYAVGDIHGCFDLLLKMVKAIEQDAIDYGVVDAKIIFLGDYVDRGPGSREVVDYLSKGEFLPTFEKIFLMGNHEEMMIVAVEKPTWGMQDVWLVNGGTETLLSYGVQLNRNAPELSLAHFGSIVPESHWTWLKSLRLYYDTGSDLYVHAGIDPTRPLEQQTSETLLWIRREFLLATSYEVPRRVIFGHTPMRDVMILPHQIGVDTGAVFRGKLSAVAIDGDAVRIIQVLDETPQT